MANRVDLKMVIVGDFSVGKTSLVHRFVTSEFPRDPSVTLGASFMDKIVELPDPVHPQKAISVIFGMWDCAGSQSSRPSLLSVYSSGAAVVFVVFDVGNRESFEVAQTLTKQLVEGPNKVAGHLLGSPIEPVFVLVGNKIDQSEVNEVDRLGKSPSYWHDEPRHERQVSFEEAARFAQESQMQYAEVSAKTGAGVTLAFKNSAITALNRYAEHARSESEDMLFPSNSPLPQRLQSETSPLLRTESKQLPQHTCFCHLL